MFLVLTVGLLDVKITKTVDFDVEEPVIADKPSESKSFLDRIRESEFKRKLNERFDRLTNRFKKPAAEPVREELPKPLLKVPELDFGENPEKVTYGAEGLPDEEFPKPIDDSWDITTEEDKKLKLTDFEDKFGKRRSSWKNIFKSDSDLLEKYLTDPSARAERLEEPEVRKSLAKLSRTQTAELFTKITQNEIAEIRKKNPTLSKDAVEQLYIKTFNENERSFKTLLKETDPTSKKQYILIPSKPADMQANSLVNFKFEILDISEYDPSLTIAENAERLKKSQDLSIRANRFSPESPTNDLATYMKNYLEDNPNDKSLKALLVNDFTALNRTTNVADAQAVLAKILNTSPRMESLFRNLTADQLTDITKAQIKAQEKNMNLAGRGAKVSYEEAQRIFKQNAKVYQRFTKADNLIIPAEDASRKNQNSFKFEIIDLRPIKNELAKLDYKNVDLEILDPSKSRDFRSQKNIKATDAMNDIIQKIKIQQPEIKLSDVELAKELINSLRNNTIELPKQAITPTAALTKIAEEKFGAEKVNKIIMDIRDASENPYSEQTTREVNQALQKLIYSPRQ